VFVSVTSIGITRHKLTVREVFDSYLPYYNITRIIYYSVEFMQFKCINNIYQRCIPSNYLGMYPILNMNDYRF